MVKVGVIGAGKWGMNHIRSFSEIDCDFIGFSDKDSSKKSVADKYGVRFFADYNELLREVDAVTIAVPTDKHYDVVKSCLEAGKHVLIEKPITLESEKAKKLVELARDKKLILSVGYLFRFNAAVMRLKELLKRAGNIQYITARYIHSSKPPRKDSGVIFNLGIHLIDTLNFILDKRPKRIFAKKGNLLSKDLEDSAIVIFDYNNFMVNLELSCCHPLKKRDMWVIAEDEKIYADLLEQKIIRYPLKVGFDKVDAGNEIQEDIIKNEPLKEELKHFCECVEKSKERFLEELNIGKEEYYTTRMCELSMESAIDGKEKGL